MTSSTPAPPRADLHPAAGLLGLGVLAATADAALTWFGMQVAAVHGSLAFTELNPVMRRLVQALGGAGAMGVRVAMGVAVLGYLAWTARRSRWTWRPLMVATALTWAVVAWNVVNLYVAVR